MDKIIEFSTRNRLAVLILTALLVVWGFYSLNRLPIDAMPDITNKQVNILTLSQNLGAVEIEQFITSPIELEMSNIPGLVEQRSISKYGLSFITLVFKDETDLYWARQQVSERLSTVKENLPENCGTPQLAPITTGIGEIYQYVLMPADPADPADQSFSLMELRTIQDWVIRKNLLGSPGVADISSFGGFKKEFHAKIKPEQMRALNVTVSELFEAVKAGNNNTGGAYMEKDERAHYIRGIGLSTTTEDIKNTVIKIHFDSPVLVKDVAEVELGNSLRYGAMTMNGQGEVVGGVVLMQMGENASNVIEQLKERLEEVKKKLPEGLVIETFIDRQNLVQRTTSTVTKNLVEGAIVVLIVLIIFLGDLRASLIAASVIPLSMLFAFGLMVQFGVIGNLMSLGALDFGLIVDGAVIVVESIAFVLAVYAARMGNKMSYESRQEIVIEGVKMGKKTGLFGILIILVVYTPILFLSGVEGKMFRPMALTVAFAIIGALILAFTYVPMMCAWVMKPHKVGGVSDRFVDFLYFKIYRPYFVKTLRYQGLLISTVVVLLVISGITFTRIGGEFIPKLDEGDIQIEVRLPVGTSLNKSIDNSLKVQAALLKKFPDEIKDVISKIGTSEIPLDPVPMECADYIVVTKDKSNWGKVKSKQELIEEVVKVFDDFPGLTISVQQPIEARFNDLLSGAKTDVVFKVFGNDLNEMTRIGKDIMSVLRPIPGASDVQMQLVNGLPQVRINYNRAQMAFYGIKIQDVNDIIQTAFSGKVTGIIYDEDRRFDLVVRLHPKDRNSLETIENLLIRTHQGNNIPLKKVASITTDIGPTEIRHNEKKRFVQVGVNVRGTDMESLVKIANKEIKKKVNLPYGYEIISGGQFENLRIAKQRLQIVVPIALAVIFALLFASFGTFKESLLIFTAVPLSAVGGIFALYFTEINFSISAGVGFICLFGIAVLNGIMLVNEFKNLENKGIKEIYLIVVSGVRNKFRPVLMTSAVAALGFLPMAIATGAGAEVQKPLATVVIGGLILSTLLTLFVLPVLYILFGKVKVRAGNRKSKRQKAAIGIILLAIVIPLKSSFAQDNPVSRDGAKQLALEKHPQMQVAESNLKRQRQLLPTAFEVINPEFLFQSPDGLTMRPSVLAWLDFPTFYYHRSKALNNQVGLAETEKMISKNLLLYQVEESYNRVQFLIARRNILYRQDSLFSAILDINNLRYEIGQISNLERINSEARYRSVRNSLQQTEAALVAAKLRLANIIGSPGDSSITPDHALKAYPLLTVMPGLVMNNPFVDYYTKQMKLSERMLKMEKARAFPGIMLGYFNQATPSDRSLYRFQYGITVPVAFWSYRARIASANTGRTVAEKQYQANLYKLNDEYLKALSDYRQYREALNYFEQIGIQQSHQLLEAASESFRLGSITYYQYLQNLQQIFEIDLGYVDALNQFNEASIILNFITGQFALE